MMLGRCHTNQKNGIAGVKHGHNEVIFAKGVYSQYKLLVFVYPYTTICLRDTSTGISHVRIAPKFCLLHHQISGQVCHGLSFGGDARYIAEQHAPLKNSRLRIAGTPDKQAHDYSQSDTHQYETSRTEKIYTHTKRGITSDIFKMAGGGMKGGGI